MERIYITGSLLGIIFIFMIYEPKIGKTTEGNILLWFNGNNKRKYIRLW